MTIKYYRPYLTLEELIILERLVEDTNPTLCRKFSKLIASANAGVTKPAHTITSIEESIGLEDNTIDTATKRKRAYDKKLALGASSLSIEEKELAETYEWEHGL